MAVDVKLHPLLVKRARSRRESFTLPHADGIRPIDILRNEGFSETDAEAVMVLVNSAQVELDEPLKDGDRIEFMVGISGG